jgi:hypothetical protein
VLRRTKTYTIDNSLLTDSEPVYSNHIQLLFTASEVILQFGRVEPPQVEESDLASEEELTIKAKPVIRVIIPVSQFKPFHDLVIRQYKNFEAINASEDQTDS